MFAETFLHLLGKISVNRQNGYNPRGVRVKKKTAGIIAGTTRLAAIGGTVGYQVADKGVQVTADGQTSTVHTFGSTVGDVLKAQGITLGEHDTVVPGAESAINDGTHIDVGYGRPLTVTLNGQKSQVWTTATTLDEALDQIGVTDAARLSVSRSTPIGRQGLAVDAVTPKKVTLTDGSKKATVISSTATTVDAMLDEQKIVLRPKDVVKPAPTTPVTEGLKVTVDRIEVKTETVTTKVPFQKKTTTDETLAAGSQKVTVKGVDGKTDQVIQTTYLNGELSARTVVSSITTQPTSEEVTVGTKAAAPATATTTPSSTATASTKPSAAATSKSTSTSTSGLNTADTAMWDRIAQCESSGNWSINSGNGYYGGLQFNLQTWQAVGGTKFAPRPDLATKAQQIDRANALRAERGLQPWGCAHAA